MPAVSQAQQKLMGMAYALKKGEMKPEDASQEVKDLADSMTLQQLKDYASTKHEGIPKKKPVEEYNFFWWDTQAQQAASQAAASKRDQTDILVQSFMDFVTGKRNSKDKDLEEDFAAPAASVTNTPGMGNVDAPGVGKVGSGDTFNAASKRKKKKSTDDYEEWLKKKSV
jgi:hypothetical protein